jgi:hypothetical protein
MTTAKWTINTREQQDLHYYPAPRFNEKWCLLVWGGDNLRREESHVPQLLCFVVYPTCSLSSKFHCELVVLSETNGQIPLQTGNSTYKPHLKDHQLKTTRTKQTRTKMMPPTKGSITSSQISC